MSGLLSCWRGARDFGAASLLVYGPGHYRFRDFFIVGLPLTLIVFVVTLLLVPRIWPLGQVTMKIPHRMRDFRGSVSRP